MNARLCLGILLLAGRLTADDATGPQTTPAPEAGAAVAPVAPAPAAPRAADPGQPVAPTGAEGELRLNFQGVPFDTVLDYLSKAAGFVIIREVAVTGKIDIVSHQPVTADQAVALVTSLLNDRGYALLRTDRVLRVVKRDDARTRDLPVISGSDPANVPRTSELVTQVVPLRHTNATKLADTLKPLLPALMTLNANDDSNALIVTDTQTNIRRMLEIIRALDTAVSSILEVQVLALRYADAVETADVINKVYENPTTKSATSATGGGQNGFFGRMRGGGDQGADTSGDAASGSKEAKQIAGYVKAVADQRGNTVIVTAPAEAFKEIRELVTQLDTPMEAVSALRVFPLRFADATEVANTIVGLYPDSTSASRAQSNNQAGRRQFPGQGMFGGAPQAEATPAAAQSARKLSESKVLAVADTRTNAVIVSASTATMENIAGVIKELDTTTANVPTVYVYQLQNADVTRAKEIIQSMFKEMDTSSSTSSSSATTARTTSTTVTGNTSRANQNSSGSSSGMSRNQLP